MKIGPDGMQPTSSPLSFPTNQEGIDMLTVWRFEELEELIKGIHFRDWQFLIKENGSGFLLQVRFPALDHSTPGVWRIQKGRKWFISAHSTTEEILQTALLAVLTALEHEAREEFQFQGITLFQPHTTLSALLQAAKEQSLRDDDHAHAVWEGEGGR